MLQGRNAVSEHLPGLVDVYEENISYEYFEERPEQVFSTALIEPFGVAAMNKSVPNLSNLLIEPPPIQKNKTKKEEAEKKIEQIESNLPKTEPQIKINSQTQTEAEAETQTETKTKTQKKDTKKELDSNMHSRASPAPKICDNPKPKEENKTSEKKVPIEERLRLKEIEREVIYICTKSLQGNRLN